MKCVFGFWRHFESGGGGGVLGLIFVEYVPLASQSPYPTRVYSVANYRLHLSHFWANMLFSRSHLSHFLFLRIDPSIISVWGEHRYIIERRTIKFKNFLIWTILNHVYISGLFKTYFQDGVMESTKNFWKYLTFKVAVVQDHKRGV